MPFTHLYSVGRYHIDFLIGNDLAVEIDGWFHGFPKIKDGDTKKTSYLESLGYKVFRFSEQDVRGCVLISCCLSNCKENKMKKKVLAIVRPSVVLVKDDQGNTVRSDLI